MTIFKRKDRFSPIKSPFFITILIITLAFILLLLFPSQGNAQLTDISKPSTRIGNKVTIADETVISETRNMLKIISTNDDISQLIINKYSNDITTYDIRYFLMKARIKKLDVYKEYTIYLDKACKEEIIEYFRQLNYQ
jgi:hypothetical protein